MITRQQIVDEARTYLGTKHHHCGRLKGVGIDCIGLLTGVAKHFGITSHDLKGYSRYPDGVTLLRELRKCLNEIPKEFATTGDVLIFWMDRQDRPCHAGILTSPDTIIHTYTLVKEVVEHRLDDYWRTRIAGAFRYPGVM